MFALAPQLNYKFLTLQATVTFVSCPNFQQRAGNALNIHFLADFNS